MTRKLTNGIKTSSYFDDIEDALAAFKDEEFLIVMDDEDKENEGDLIIVVTHITTEKMTSMIMIRFIGGFVCISSSTTP
ncbi:3,4-dihydroxy 2-butanone 4-phosphate synthase [Paramarasmius palmivorus]|uniref:3,4-dihydroxy 2-butanone 4-phosphate synthase n=1 Tax=Paramarasmius palmivorus TaxID=297713 RepID=A0AAW0CHX3_9AGAR